MRRTLQGVSILFTGLLAWAGCTESGFLADHEPVGEPVPSVLDRSWPALAILDWGALDFSDPALLADLSRADFLILETSYLWRGEKYPSAIADLKARNPELKVVGYFNAHGSWLSWGETDRSDPDTPDYGWDWYQATREYWSYTTDGDTMFCWPGKVLLDVLDPDCRAAMTEVLAGHWQAHDNVLDGIFWDHFNNYLWVSNVIPGVEGDMDLDGDGIPHLEDEDEMQAYREASVDLIQRVRLALGENVIQVANGQRAATDSLFAGMFDGIFYEEFPEYGFSGEKMRDALDLGNPNNLFAARTWCRTQNGGPWLILSHLGSFSTWSEEEEDWVIWRRAEFNRVAGLLAGGLSVYYAQGGQHRYSLPEIEVELGLPLAEAGSDGDRITRNFQDGQVILDFTDATHVAPFGFAIIRNDSLLQGFPMNGTQP